MDYRIRLEPLDQRHADDLAAAGSDASIWLYLPGKPFRQRHDAQHWIAAAHEDQRRGKRIPFAIVDAATGQAIGSTSFSHMRKEHRSTMIGWSWLAPSHRGTSVNAESKYLLLEHAFETMGAMRVDLRIDERNIRSQRAAERLGAVREGVLRRHMIENGIVRNTVYYSFIDSEWPDTKTHIEEIIQHKRDTAAREMPSHRHEAAPGILEVA
ncbi:GNAT family N-acetyltransferase [Propionivibrio dicarboxylicus]|uniref:Protein N-acetyltransferase, RimJ/RimL family n=1 Tax=Propionivibrio dicarboxylicus TaxID=83767 RepID=A0A1G8LQN9_9RHOO|nr:GNAT family protein [Propionivibrio dicarboxylicus]SDI57787.1 Protein N-acetyltransferase, RimJ/RimL family [Propionivibrio dicarboxylicus]